MTKTGTQNRSYDEVKNLMVRAEFKPVTGDTVVHTFDWNNRHSVRAFASNADKCIRDGGTVITRLV